MASATLNDLASKYGQRYGAADLDALKSLANEFLQSRAKSVLDAAAIGLAFDVVFSSPTIEIASITPDMATAWEKAYPNVPLEDLQGRSAEELAGLISGWKGKLFEVEVARRLSAGEWVGDYHIESDQVAHLAKSAIQPGWDIVIYDSNHNLVETIQLKATDSVSYIHEALDRYPTTPILATSEVAERMNDVRVINSDISNNELTSTVSDHLAPNATDAVTGTAFALPITVILATEVVQVLRGKKSAEQATASGGDRVLMAVAATTIGAAVSVVATPFVGAIAAFFARMWLSEKDDPVPAIRLYSPPRIKEMCQRLESIDDEVRALRAHYVAEPEESRVRPTPSLSERDECIRLVDDGTRLEIERGATPLGEWLLALATKDMKGMTATELEQHLADLAWIKKNDWVRHAHPITNPADRIVEFFNGQRKELNRQIDAALSIGAIFRKKFSGPVSAQEEKFVTTARMTWIERLNHAYKARLEEGTKG